MIADDGGIVMVPRGPDVPAGPPLLFPDEPWVQGGDTSVPSVPPAPLSGSGLTGKGPDLDKAEVAALIKRITGPGAGASRLRIWDAAPKLGKSKLRYLACAPA